METKDRLFVITGPRGVGKTTLAATYLPPGEEGKVYYHDSEHSASQIVSQLAEQGTAFGRYVSLSDQFSGLPTDDDLLHRINQGSLPWVTPRQQRALANYYGYVLTDLDKHLEQGKFRVYIHDTLEKIEAGMAAWVELNKRKAGVSTTAHGRLWTDGVFPLYEQLVNAIWARGVEVVILTSHLRTPWEDNRPVVSKVAPGGKKLLYKLSSLMIWLVNEDDNPDGAPAGLVLKERLGRLEPDPEIGEWRTRRMVPRRVPHCTWFDIRRYLRDGCDLANPAQGETLSRAEQDMISELLNDAQMQLMVLSAEKDLEQLRQDTVSVVNVGGDGFEATDEPVLSPKQQTHLMAEQGKAASDIAEAVDKPLPLVKRWMREMA